MGWVRTKDALPGPDDGDWVLGVVTGKIHGIRMENAVLMVSYDTDSGKWFLEERPWPEVSVSHWMRLPDLPEEVRT